MRYLVVLVVVFLVGCDDGPVEPREVGPYEVTTLRTLSEGTEVSFVDLNENGQALWHEGEQAILWDQGTIRQLPLEIRGRFLGENTKVLGYGPEDLTAALWEDGDLTVVAGSPLGITLDGTAYIERNFSLFAWRDGTLTATDRPTGNVVGPEGRIWTHRLVETEGLGGYFDLLQL